MTKVTNLVRVVTDNSAHEPGRARGQEQRELKNTLFPHSTVVWVNKPGLTLPSVSAECTQVMRQGEGRRGEVREGGGKERGGRG